MSAAVLQSILIISLRNVLWLTIGAAEAVTIKHIRICDFPATYLQNMQHGEELVIYCFNCSINFDISNGLAHVP